VTKEEAQRLRWTFCEAVKVGNQKVPPSPSEDVLCPHFNLLISEGLVLILLIGLGGALLFLDHLKAFPMLEQHTAFLERNVVQSGASPSKLVKALVDALKY
jgi:hypothetical protein